VRALRHKTETRSSRPSQSQGVWACFSPFADSLNLRPSGVNLLIIAMAGEDVGVVARRARRRRNPFHSASSTSRSYCRSPLSEYLTTPFPSWHSDGSGRNPAGDTNGTAMVQDAHTCRDRRWSRRIQQRAIGQGCQMLDQAHGRGMGHPPTRVCPSGSSSRRSACRLPIAPAHLQELTDGWS
jgi:hypothetical protein